jgi:hypothetical protein
MTSILDRAVATARRGRARRLHALIIGICERRGRCAIIDLGGRADYWRAMDLEALRARGVHITLVNTEVVASDDPMIASIQADACNLAQFADGQFDLAHSNSTIEHVGEWSRMAAFAHEMRRLAPSYYVQTPYFWFPIEPHFLSLGFHWLPETVRVRRLLRRRFGHHVRAQSVDEAVETVRSARLLDRTWFQALFPDARHSAERFAGLTKSLVAVRTDDAA